MNVVKLKRCCAAMLWLCCASAFATEKAEPWKVKKFEIFTGTAGSAEFPDAPMIGDQETVPYTPMPDDVKQDIEEYLAWSAETLERLGFNPPVLEPIIENAQGEPVYRIYYHDFQAQGMRSVPGVWRDNPCATGRQIINLNARVFLRELNSGKIVVTDQGYQVLSHELFHAVQASYPLFKENCALTGDWIYEATANAVGIDMAAWGYKKVVRPKYPNFEFQHPNKWIGARWGRRAYDVSTYILNGEGESEHDRWAYETSSFWRFLGEYAATDGAVVPKVESPQNLAKEVNLEDVEPTEPHWQYLIDFFNSKIGGEPTRSNSMAWIDKQLSNDERFDNLGLDRMFPIFVNTFATYGGTRAFPRAPNSSQAQRQQKSVQDHDSEGWMANLFVNTIVNTKCPSVELSSSQKLRSLPFDIHPFASLCFSLTSGYHYPTDVHISISGNSRAQMEALSIGATTGTKRSQFIARGKVTQQGSQWRANWVFTVQPGLRENYIVSNVALEPGQTSRLSSTVEFSATDSNNNWAVYGPKPPPYGPQPPAQNAQAPGEPPKTAAKTPSKSQQEQLADQLEAGMETLNPNTAHGNRMMRHANVRECRNHFESTVCGPHTTIRLERMPGMFGSLMTSTGSGGTFGQFTSMMSGLAGTDMMFSSEKSRAALEKSENMDASLVTIKIPLIDYGFTGTFKNALIVANRKGGGAWESVEPGDGDPALGQGPKLTGQVTIEEYSPSVLRGSYSGNLVESFEDGTESEEKSPATRSINGTFQVVATWAGDDRIVVIADEPEQIMDDLTENFGIDTSGYEIIQVGDKQRVVPKQGGTASAGGGSVDGECSCECDFREFADELCEMLCEEEFTACD